MMRTCLPALAACLALVACADEAEVPANVGNPQVEIVTSMGAMTVELWPDKAPRTVENFLMLVDDGFYEGTVFHRVIPNFMIQGGGYNADLTYREPPRRVVNESIGGAANARWTIAMARHADPDSADSQFFVNVNDNVHLNAEAGEPGYTVFGTLVAGFEVAEDIELTDTGPVGDKISVPLTPVVIQQAVRIGTVDSADSE